VWTENDIDGPSCAYLKSRSQIWKQKVLHREHVLQGKAKTSHHNTLTQDTHLTKTRTWLFAKGANTVDTVL